MFEHRYVNGWGPAFCRFSPISLVEYNLPSTLNHWQPNLFIDIDDQYERKVELLQHFTSQIHRSYFQRPMLDAFHSNFQCSKKGLHIVERFKLIEVIYSLLCAPWKFFINGYVRLERSLLIAMCNGNNVIIVFSYELTNEESLETQKREQ